LLFPFGDVDGMARAAERLIQDPAGRMAMGQAARDRARERFSADRIVPRYVELYRRVCALPSQPD
jgi:glycosyltransferase involved in cell wall biosynthesis